MLVCPSTHLSVGIFEFLSLYSLDTHSTSLLFLHKQILFTILFMYVFHKRCVVFVRRRATLLKVKIIFNSIKKSHNLDHFGHKRLLLHLHSQCCQLRRVVQTWRYWCLSYSVLLCIVVQFIVLLVRALGTQRSLAGDWELFSTRVMSRYNNIPYHGIRIHYDYHMIWVTVITT